MGIQVGGELKGRQANSMDAAQLEQAKRHRLGMIKFIGELFKVQMMKERVVHECVIKLLSNVENPNEGDIESVCKPLTAVGSILDNPKGHQRMKEMNPHVPLRLQLSNKISNTLCNTLYLPPFVIHLCKVVNSHLVIHFEFYDTWVPQ